MATRPWSPDELVIAFGLYCRTKFGRLHKTNPEIVAVAAGLGRTASALAMKCCNFASLDPAHKARGITGLGNASAADRETYEAYRSDMVRLEGAAEEAAKRLGIVGGVVAERAEVPSTRRRRRTGPPDEWAAPQGPTEVERTVAVRRVQAAFRRAVLAAYDEACAACDIALPELLTAGHIIPWSADEARRADPTNGIAFCALHDRAFDRGLFTVGEDLRIAVSPRVRIKEPGAVHRAALCAVDGATLRVPTRFAPDGKALDYHRKQVFGAA